MPKRDTEVHSCSSECPCQTGGEPMPDFSSAETTLLLCLLFMANEDMRHDDERP